MKTFTILALTLFSLSAPAFASSGDNGPELIGDEIEAAAGASELKKDDAGSAGYESAESARLPSSAESGE